MPHCKVEMLSCNLLGVTYGPVEGKYRVHREHGELIYQVHKHQYENECRVLGNIPSQFTLEWCKMSAES